MAGAISSAGKAVASGVKGAMDAAAVRIQSVYRGKASRGKGDRKKPTSLFAKKSEWKVEEPASSTAVSQRSASLPSRPRKSFLASLSPRSMLTPRSKGKDKEPT